MKCLVTGSSGFLGQALCKKLGQQGHEVLQLPHNLFGLPKLAEVYGDVDWIFHLASYGNMYHHNDREEVFSANVAKTYWLLESLNNVDYKKFIYISSSSVLLPTQTLYSACKKACEDLIQAYDKPIVIVRPYTVIGVGEQKEHLIPTLIDAAFSGKVIPFVAKPRHDFIDVEDVVAGLIHLAKSPYVYVKPQELGSALSHSNEQVLKIVERVTGKKISTQPMNSLRTYDSKNWVSPHKWSVKTLEQSIGEMVSDYQSNPC